MITPVVQRWRAASWTRSKTSPSAARSRCAQINSAARPATLSTFQGSAELVEQALLEREALEQLRADGWRGARLEAEVRRLVEDPLAC